MIDTVELVHSPDLILVLDVLGIPWVEGRPRNGAQGTIVIRMDTATDGRLEYLVGQLSELRWKYEPGRHLQFALDMPGV